MGRSITQADRFFTETGETNFKLVFPDGSQQVFTESEFELFSNRFSNYSSSVKIFFSIDEGIGLMLKAQDGSEVILPALINRGRLGRNMQTVLKQAR